VSSDGLRFLRSILSEEAFNSNHLLPLPCSPGDCVEIPFLSLRATEGSVVIRREVIARAWPVAISGFPRSARDRALVVSLPRNDIRNSLSSMFKHLQRIEEIFYFKSGCFRGIGAMDNVSFNIGGELAAQGPFFCLFGVSCAHQLPRL